jgi:hypothetical protein
VLELIRSRAEFLGFGSDRGLPEAVANPPLSSSPGAPFHYAARLPTGGRHEAWFDFRHFLVSIVERLWVV